MIPKLSPKRPHVSGWYWCQSPISNELFVREFIRVGNRTLTALLGQPVTNIEFSGYRYAGPIPKPQGSPAFILPDANGDNYHRLDPPVR